MAGTKAGGKAAAKTNKTKYGEDYYRNMGKIGGKAECKTPKGFAANPKLASKAGKIGGKISKRGKNRETV